MMSLWSHVAANTRLWIALNIVALITIGLWLDARFGWTGQHIATAWTLVVWAWIYRRGQQAERRVLVLATVISGVGEVFLSLVWGLYDYQFRNVPLFVPLGHALLMTLGILVARELRARLALAQCFVAVVSLCACAWALYVWQTNLDRFGVVLFGLFVVCIAVGLARTLYAVMFVLALSMELYGTALGNWTWEPTAPWVHLSAMNPPFSAGAFYCALDLIVLGALQVWSRGRSPRPVLISTPHLEQNEKADKKQ
jgi:hypothetical protein